MLCVYEVVRLSVCPNVLSIDGAPLQELRLCVMTEAGEEFVQDAT